MSFCSRGDVFTKDVIETWLEYKRKLRSMPSGCAPILGSSLCTSIYKVIHYHSVALPFHGESDCTPQRRRGECL